MLQLKEIRDKLSKEHINLHVIAKAIQIDIRTLNRLIENEKYDPRHSTVELLSDYIERHGI